MFTHIWLALFGWWTWDDLPALPPELMLLPPGVPLNIYDFGCWARQTIVPLTIVAANRPVRPLPFRLDELHTGARAGRRARSLRTTPRLVRAARPHRPRLQPPAAGRCAGSRWRARERWIIERQEADGCWGGIQPPWVYSVIALHLLGYPIDHPVMQAALDGLDSFAVYEDDRGWLEACQSPVWDTCLAVIALRDAGRARRPPGARQGPPTGCSARRCACRGDWAVRRPQLAPGGWAFEFDNDNYPDIDDTAEVVLALRRVDHPDRGAHGGRDPARRGLDRRHAVLGPAAGAPSTPTTPARYRRSCRSATSARSSTRRPPTSPPMSWRCSPPRAWPRRAPPARGLEWLLREQEPDGSWFGRWGVNYVYGTGAVLPALVGAGHRRRRPARSAGPSTGCARTRTTTAAGARTCAPTPTRPGSAAATPPPRRPPGRCSALLAAGERATTSGASAASRWLAEHPARGRLLGRAALHRHRLPLGLLHQLPPLPAGLPALGPRPLARRTRHERPALLVLVAARGSRPRAARRGGARRAAVLRTGMGPRRPAAAAARGRADPARARGGAAASAAALDPGLEPGDVVVADELRGADGPFACDGARAGRVPRARRAAHRARGPLVRSAHVVRGAERAGSPRDGAIAVDMESAWLRAAPPPAARSPLCGRGRHALARARAPRARCRGGITAFRALRRAASALLETGTESLPLAPRR